MARKTFAEIAEINKAAVEESLNAVRKAFAEKNLDAYDKGMVKLEKDVQAYNQSLCNVDFDKFMQSDTPIIEAVKQFYVDGVKIKEEKDKESGAIVGINIEPKKSRINLEALCKFGDLGMEWAIDSSKLLALLTLRETDVFAIKASDLAKKSRYFINAATAKAEGGTPDSNTQIVRLLQQIIDEAIFVDDGKGNNKYKCNNHDIAFIQDAGTKMDTKEKCTIAMLNERQFKTVMMSVFAHCLGEDYKVKAAKIKNA